MFKLLSHPLDTDSPGWPGNPTYSYKKFTALENGDMANTCCIEFHNHFGTHFDAPYHFDPKGIKIADLPFDTFIYDRPLMLDIPKTYKEIYVPEDFEPYREQIEKADILLIHSGLTGDRDTRPEDFSNICPAIGTEAAKYLMDNFRLKALMVDWLSIASPLYPEHANKAHQYFMGLYHDHFTCLIEDGDFRGIIGEKVERIFAIPLLMKGVDSSPVTVFAECK